MTQTMTSLYEKEIENFCQKVTEPEFKQIQLHELFLNTTSGSDLINSMRKLILEKTHFFKTIQHQRRQQQIDCSPLFLPLCQIGLYRS